MLQRLFNLRQRGSHEQGITPAGFKTGIEEVAERTPTFRRTANSAWQRWTLVDKNDAMAVDALMTPAMTKRFRLIKKSRRIL
jgi:hypothetical protein